MHIKLLTGFNYRCTYILLKEEGDLYHLLNDKGEVEQVKKSDLPVDMIKEVKEEEVFRSLRTGLGHHAQLDYLLKLRGQREKSEIEKMLGKSFTPHHKSKICFEDPSGHARMLLYYSHFRPAQNNCEVEIFKHQLEFIKGGVREMVVLVLDEFGTLYCNGTHLRKYLSEIPNKKRKGKVFWSLQIDYDGPIRVNHPKAHSFEDYSSERSFVRLIHQDTRAQTVSGDNVLNLNMARFARDRDKKKEQGGGNADFKVIGSPPMQQKIAIGGGGALKGKKKR